MSSHKTHPRPKPRGEREKAKPPAQQSAPPRSASAHAAATEPRLAGTGSPTPTKPDQIAPSVPEVSQPASPTNGNARPVHAKAEGTPPTNVHTRRQTKQNQSIAREATSLSPAQEAAPAENVVTPAVPEHATPVFSENIAPPSAPRSHQANGNPYGPKHVTQRTPTPPSELSEMFATLRDLFVQDRANAARPDAARCGICYLTFPREQLVYREAEGYYACPECLAGMNGTHLPMLRRQRT